MGIGKSLIGSVIGAALAFAIHYGIKQSTGESYIWFPLVTGLIVGIAARMVAGSSLSSGSRVVAGGIAALIAGVAIFAPDVLDSMRSDVDFGPIDTKDRLVNASIAKNDVDQDDANIEDNDDGTADATEPQAGTGSGDGDSDSDDSGDESESSADAQTDVGGDQADSATNEDGTTDPETAANQTTQDMNSSFEERSQPRGIDAASVDSAVNMEKFAELIKKKKHESWIDTFLPVIFAGAGMVMAYVIGQSGSPATPPKS